MTQSSSPPEAQEVAVKVERHGANCLRRPRSSTCSIAATEPPSTWTKTGSSVADARARRYARPQYPLGYITVRMPTSASRLVALANSPE